MTTTITPVGTTTTIIPDFVAGYAATYPTRNVLHAALNRRTRTATVNGSGLRTGTLTILFVDEDDKTNAVEILNSPAVFQLSSSDLNSIDMLFVIAGNVTEQLDPEAQAGWLVTFDLEEQA